MNIWTLVRSLTSHEDEPCLEVVTVAPADEHRVLEAGGLIFNTLCEALDSAYEENYPNGAGLLEPCPTGDFDKCTIPGCDLYIPKRD